MVSLVMYTLTFNVILLPNAMAEENRYNNETYNNHYDSKYSKHPTKLNQYESPTGTFEGFFVSFVEFCKRGLIIDNIVI